MGMRIGTMLLVAVVVTGCMGVKSPDRIISDPGGSFVRVDRDRGAHPQPGYAHPASLSPERLRALLRAIEVESPQGPFLGQTVREPLFDPADLDFLSPAISEALRQAGPHERVVFYLRQAGRLLRAEITTGAIAVTRDAVSFTLGHYRRTDVEGVGKEDRQAGIQNEIRSDPMFRVFDRNVRLFVQAGKPGLAGGLARTVLFPLSAMASTGDKPAPAPPVSPTPPAQAGAVDAPPKSEKANTPPVSSAVSMEALQRQIKEVTESNLDLRAKLKELQEQRAQVQDRSAAASEELIRLRQELAEIKQLLADQVLELNRLKGKSGETGKGETTPSPSR